ncbi:MAG TPA: LysR family transcriptional regulator [Thauera sp.]|uniref:LysR family transcriptional regulator n=1 Tax=Thauera sp. TaxID=1905334 RepID=UPI002C423FA6|nr:LysR family transcriptional regulator [Thauera sp.]HRP25026.1 LysR family transcriptional regulator [Thauera sp.]HRP66620.1 LysR family transcriptional regulator [Thauera sp.]
MMTELNYKHLRYFWTVARVGTIAEAGRVLNLAPHSISAQLATFEAALGVSLFRRVGRRLALTEAGERILGHAEQIFALGDQIADVLRDDSLRRSLPFRIGFPDSMPKSVVHRLIEPALHVERPGRLVCREAPLAELLAELAVHRLDLVIADRPIPPNVSVRGHSTLLSESSLTVFAAAALAARLRDGFPASLDGAPFLLPGEDVVHRAALLQWFDTQRVRPSIVAEFDDSALMKAFGQSGAGAFVAPSSIADHVCRQYDVEALGEIAEVRSQVYAITTERRLSHPAMQAIHHQAAGSSESLSFAAVRPAER